MRIIISPAKKMNVRRDDFLPESLPVFMEKTEVLKNVLRSFSYDELKTLWKCNDKISEQNFQRLQSMNLYENLTPAVFSYEGLAFQHMAPQVFTDRALLYTNEKLRILSGFYGILKPFDGVTPYRLEMQAPLKVAKSSNLYEFWSSSLYEELQKDNDDKIIINLASKEYSKAIESWLKPEDTFITCVFGTLKESKVVQKATEAKMARGDMVRFMAEHDIDNPNQIKEYNGFGYVFNEELSSETEYVFIKK